MPGSYVCSGALKARLGVHDVERAVARRRPPQMAAALHAYGVDLTGPQQTKTRATLDFFSARQASPANDRKPGDRQREQEPLGDGHTRSSPQMRPSIAATKTTIPTMTRKSAMGRSSLMAR
jgi:hypothetical protein